MKEAQKKFATPVYRCRKTRRPPAVDGMISAAIWKQAEAVPLRIATTGEQPQQPTEVRLLYDDDFLYVAFHCVDKDAWGSLTLRNDHVYREEAVEIFIDPTRGRRSYIEIEVSPLNTVFDLYILNDPRCPPMRPLWQWNCLGLRTAVRVERGADHRTKSWNCEMAVPFNQMHDAPNIPPKPGDRWRMNLYRIDHLPHLDEHTAWSQITGRSFHCPERFGELLFLEPGERKRPRQMAADKRENARIRQQALTDKRNGKADVFEKTSGAWRRKDSPAEIVKAVRASFRRSVRRRR